MINMVKVFGNHLNWFPESAGQGLHILQKYIFLIFQIDFLHLTFSFPFE